jgi:hypothetical protein
MPARGGVAGGDGNAFAGRRDDDGGEECGVKFKQSRLVVATIRMPGGQDVQLEQSQR